MSNILDNIAAWKIKETALRKVEIPIERLKDYSRYNSPCVSLSDKLSSATNPHFIAEFKRASPSKGIIREDADPIEITQAYQIAGAAAVSVLTDEHFFGAHKDDFSEVRKHIDLPMLRKDFILEEYQVHETKAMGADIILLIAALLHPTEVLQLGSLAKELGMEVLLELHTAEELDRICEPVSMVGINNRNLKTFEVNLDHSKSLARKLPDGIPTIAESGLSDPASVIELHQAGFKGFLIGETFMRADDPGKKCLEFLTKTKTL